MNVMNKIIRTLLIMLCAALLLAAPLLAATQEQAVPALPAEAQTALERGLSAAKQGEWEMAIKYFSQAQKAAPESPEVLFNLALASVRAEGRDLLAIAWFRAYLAAAPKAPNAQQVRAQILDLEIKVEGTIGKLIRFAKDTAAQIPPDDYRKSEAYTEIAKAQAGAGDIAGAKETDAIAKEYEMEFRKKEALRQLEQEEEERQQAELRKEQEANASRSIAGIWRFKEYRVGSFLRTINESYQITVDGDLFYANMTSKVYGYPNFEGTKSGNNLQGTVFIDWTMFKNGKVWTFPFTGTVSPDGNTIIFKHENVSPGGAHGLMADGWDFAYRDEVVFIRE